MVTFQTQAVLNTTFHPGSPADAIGPLALTKGLVGLAPLTSVEASHPAVAASANVDAREAWAGLGGAGLRKGALP